MAVSETYLFTGPEIGEKNRGERLRGKEFPRDRWLSVFGADHIICQETTYGEN